MKKLKHLDQIAQAIEADAGEQLPDLHQALAEAAAGMGRVHTPAQMLLRQARQKTNLTQPAFAELINTSVATLRDWEQGRFAPPGAVVCLLKLLINHPELARELEAA